MSMVGGPPTSTGLPTDVMVESMEVGASKALLTFLGFPLRGIVGTPTILQESAGCVRVEQGAPSARTVELPIHISDSDIPLTNGAGCSTNVFYTMQDTDVAGWVRSLQLRGIALPDNIKDEVFLIIGERRLTPHS